MNRTVILLDMNAFFASVEQVANPALRGRPIAVVGEGRTVVTTASYEARAFGVKTGMSLPEARQVCPRIIPVIGAMEKYIDASMRIQRVLLDYSPLVEAFSIDECFVDITDPCMAGRSPRAVCVDIKRDIFARTGLRCSIGIGPNKFIAKLASKMQKPDGLVEIPREHIARVFDTLPLSAMQGTGIGRRTAAALEEMGIRTAGDIGRAPLSALTARFGFFGHHLHHMGRGEDDDPVHPYEWETAAKSVGHSHTLPRDTRDERVIHSYLRMLSEKVGARLRDNAQQARTVHLVVRYGDFSGFGSQRGLKYTIRTGDDICREAWGIFTGILPLSRPVRLLGVSVSGLCGDDGQQYLLGDLARARALTQAVDAINHKYGDLTVKPSAVLIAERFGVRTSCGMAPKATRRIRGLAGHGH